MSRPAAAVHRVIKAYDVRGLVGTEIDESFVHDVGAAFARLMRSEGARRVAIGYDMRDSSPSLAAAFGDGVTGQGLDVVRIGLASTDQLYFASGLLDCPGAMFTASHNPAAYNGIKLCRAGAKPVGADTGLTTISDDVIAGVATHDGAGGTVTDQDVLAEYGEFLRSLVDTDGLRPLRVAVDAGNGMAGHTTPAVLGAIDSLTLLPLYFELDGSFPNHEANPLDPANLVDLQAFVRDSGADIGLAFDGDADRCFVIDERGLAGVAVDGDRAGRRPRAGPRDRRDGDPQPDHVARGARAGDRARRHAGAFTRRALLHQGADGRDRRDFRRRTFGALLLPRLLGSRLGNAGRAARAGRARQPAAPAVRVDRRLPALRVIRRNQFHRRRIPPSCVEAVLKAFGTRIQSIDHLDGVTVDLGEGSWFNLRTSNTEPLLRLNVEGRCVEDVDAVVEQVGAEIRDTARSASRRP